MLTDASKFQTVPSCELYQDGGRGVIRAQEEQLTKEELPTKTPGNSAVAFHQS